MLNKTSLSISIHDLTKKINSGNLRFDLPMQRRGVWSLTQKRDLLDSILQNYPIPPIYLIEKGSKYWALDGQQRATAISEFLNDKYKFAKDAFRWGDNDKIIHELAGKSFSELHQNVQLQILSTNINAIIFKDASQEELNEIFVRLNSGTAMKKIELTRVNMPKHMASLLKGISKHDFLMNKINLSKKSRLHFSDYEVILHTLMLFNNFHKNFINKEVNNFIYDVRYQQFSAEKIENVLDYANSAFPKFSKFLRKSTVPALLFVAKRALERKIPAEEFGNKIGQFLEAQKTGGEYSSTCINGSSNRLKIMKRIEILEKVLTM